MNTRTPCFAAHGVFGGRAGVAGGGAEDVQGFALLGQCIQTERPKQLHGHMSLKARVGPLDSSWIYRPSSRRRRGDFIRAMGGAGVGFIDDGFQVGGRDVVGKAADQVKGQFR